MVEAGAGPAERGVWAAIFAFLPGSGGGIGLDQRGSEDARTGMLPLSRSCRVPGVGEGLDQRVSEDARTGMLPQFRRRASALPPCSSAKPSNNGLRRDTSGPYPRILFDTRPNARRPPGSRRRIGRPVRYACLDSGRVWRKGRRARFRSWWAMPVGVRVPPPAPPPGRSAPGRLRSTGRRRTPASASAPAPWRRKRWESPRRRSSSTPSGSRFLRFPW